MKLVTLKSATKNNRHGELAVVTRDHKYALRATAVAPTLLTALENWKECEQKLRELFQALERSREKTAGAFELKIENCLAPLPNAPGFYDGSAFLSHVVRARRARGDQMPESARITPLMYQGVADNNLAWNDKIDLMDPAYGGDFEGEFAAIVVDMPKGTPKEKASSYIALFTLFNDITYREIVKTELETKFGFLQSKPNSAYAPIVVTPDELGSAWKDERIALDLSVKWNGEWFGNPNGREMNFTFGALIAHACRTRPLAAGNIVGTGTISNEDKAQGFACLTERRFQEVLDTGKPITPWLKTGDRVQIEVFKDGQSLFGPIDQAAV